MPCPGEVLAPTAPPRTSSGRRTCDPSPGPTSPAARRSTSGVVLRRGHRVGFGQDVPQPAARSPRPARRGRSRGRCPGPGTCPASSRAVHVEPGNVEVVLPGVLPACRIRARGQPGAAFGPRGSPPAGLGGRFRAPSPGRTRRRRPGRTGRVPHSRAASSTAAPNRGPGRASPAGRHEHAVVARPPRRDQPRLDPVPVVPQRVEASVRRAGRRATPSGPRRPCTGRGAAPAAGRSSGASRAAAGRARPRPSGSSRAAPSARRRCTARPASPVRRIASFSAASRAGRPK